MWMGVCMYICVPLTCLASEEFRRGRWTPLELELQVIVNHHVHTGKWTQVCCKNSQCSYPLSYFPSPILFLFPVSSSSGYWPETPKHAFPGTLGFSLFPWSHNVTKSTMGMFSGSAANGMTSSPPLFHLPPSGFQLVYNVKFLSNTIKSSSSLLPSLLLFIYFIKKLENLKKKKLVS